MVIGISKTPKGFILDPLAATQPFPLVMNLGFEFLKACLKLLAFIHVMAAPVSNNQLKVMSPVVMLILGRFFPHEKAL
jgi:hypothetical protein